MHVILLCDMINPLNVYIIVLCIDYNDVSTYKIVKCRYKTTFKLEHLL